MDVKRLNDSAEEAADFLKALAAPGRLRVLCLLSSGEHSVTALAEGRPAADGFASPDPVEKRWDRCFAQQRRDALLPARG
jgi:hypothetical protein